MAAVKRSSPRTRRPPQPAPPDPLESVACLCPGFLFHQHPDLTFTHISPGLATLTGLPTETARPTVPFWDLIHEPDADSVREHLRRCAENPGQVCSLTFRLRHLQTGRITHIAERRRARCDATGQLLGYDALWQDQSRQVAAEQRLNQAAWKENLGLLTLGLAHDFNNILAGICSLSDNFLTQIDPDHPFHEGLTLISRNARHASDLVHRIVHLHRAKTGSRSYHDLNEVLRETLDLMRHVLPRHLRFTVHLAPLPLPLYVDAAELRQIIISLILNAAEAMGERGELQFETRREESPPSPPPPHAAGLTPPGPCCRLTLRDAGPGIKPHHLDSLFAPFFTTSNPRQYSGLSLYNARLFVEKHHGLIAVDTADPGTAVTLRLPLADFTEADRAEQQQRARRRTLLLVGPPDPDRARLADALRNHPFHVFTVPALDEDSLQGQDPAFDGILLQIEAADPNTPALIRSLRRQQLPTKIILHILGRHQEPMETQFLFQADLILTPDLDHTDIISHLQSLLGPQTTPD